jgi:hypothetical protein
MKPKQMSIEFTENKPITIPKLTEEDLRNPKIVEAYISIFGKDHLPKFQLEELESLGEGDEK